MAEARLQAAFEAVDNITETLQSIDASFEDLGQSVDSLSNDFESNVTSSEALDRAHEKLESTAEETSRSFNTLTRALEQTSVASQASISQANRNARAISDLEDEIDGAKRSFQSLSVVQGMSTATAATNAGAMKIAGNAIDEMGDEALKTAGQMGVMNTIMEELSLTGSALSLNLGAFNVSLRNLAPLVPIAASIGTVVSVMGAFISTLGAATVALGGFLGAGFIQQLEEIEAGFAGVENRAEAVQALMGGIKDLFVAALEPLMQIGSRDFFVDVVEGAADLVNRLAQAIAQMESTFMPLFTGFASIINREFDAIANGIEDMSETMIPILLNVFEWFMIKLPDALRFMSRVTESVVGPVGNLGGSLLSLLATIIETAVAVIQGLAPAFAVAVDLANQVIQVLNALSSGFLQAALFAGGLVLAAGKFVSIADTLANVGISAAQSMINFGNKIANVGAVIPATNAALSNQFKHLSALGSVLTRNMTIQQASGKVQEDLQEKYKDLAQSILDAEDSSERLRDRFVELTAVMGNMGADEIEAEMDEIEDAIDSTTNEVNEEIAEATTVPDVDADEFIGPAQESADEVSESMDDVSGAYKRGAMSASSASDEIADATSDMADSTEDMGTQEMADDFMQSFGGVSQSAEEMAEELDEKRPSIDLDTEDFSGSIDSAKDELDEFDEAAEVPDVDAGEFLGPMDDIQDSTSEATDEVAELSGELADMEFPEMDFPEETELPELDFSDDIGKSTEGFADLSDELGEVSETTSEIDFSRVAEARGEAFKMPDADPGGFPKKAFTPDAKELEFPVMDFSNFEDQTDEFMLDFSDDLSNMEFPEMDFPEPPEEGFQLDFGEKKPTFPDEMFEDPFEGKEVAAPGPIDLDESLYDVSDVDGSAVVPELEGDDFTLDPMLETFQESAGEMDFEGIDTTNLDKVKSKLDGLRDPARRFEDSVNSSMDSVGGKISDFATGAGEELGGAAGKVKKSMKTIGGAAKEQGALLERSLRDAGETSSLMSGAINKAGKGVANFGKRVGRAASSLKTMAVSAIRSAGALAVQAAQSMRSSMSNIALAFSQQGVVAGFKAMAASAWGAVTSLVAASASAAMTAISFVAGLIPAAISAGLALNTAFAGIPLLLAAIVGASAAVVGVLGNMGSVSSGLKGAFNALKNVIVRIGDALLSVGVPAWNLFIDVIEAVLSPVFAIIDGIGMVGEALGVAGGEGGFLMGILDGLLSGFEGLMSILGAFFDFVAPAFSFIGDLIYSAFILPFQILAKGINVVQQILGGLVALAVNKIPFLSELITGLQDGFKGIQNAIAQIPAFFDAMAKMVGGVIDDLMGALKTNVFKPVLGFVNDLIEQANKLPETEIEKVEMGDFAGGGASEALAGAQTSAEDVRENVGAGEEEPGDDVATKPDVNLSLEDSVQNNVEVQADPEDKAQLSRLTKDALEEANSFARRQQGGQ